MMRVFKALIPAALVLMATPASAQGTANQFLNDISANDLAAKVYVMGIVSGFQWANGELDSTGQKILYCEPPKLALGLDQIFDILKRYVTSHPKFGDTEVSFALLRALQDTFPCQSKTPESRAR